MRLEDEIKQKAFKNESNKAIVNIIYTFNSIDYQLKCFFKQYDLTPQQYNILRILRGSHPLPCTLNLLRERMLDKMSDASRIVERLRIKKLLKRQKSPSDKRSVDIDITSKGLELLYSIDDELEVANKNIMAGLTEEELKQLNLLLDKLRG